MQALLAAANAQPFRHFLPRNSEGSNRYGGLSSPMGEPHRNRAVFRARSVAGLSGLAPEAHKASTCWMQKSTPRILCGNAQPRCSEQRKAIRSRRPRTLEITDRDVRELGSLLGR